MRKNIAIILFCLLTSISIVQAQDSKAEKLGLISELVFIKLTSENLAIRIVNDTLIKEDDKIKFVNLYNDIKVISDQVILQLITDSRRKNCLKYFNKIDNLLVDKNITQIEESDLSKMKLKGYINNLKKINAVYNKLMAFKTSDKPNENPLLNMSLKGFFPIAMSVEDITGVLSLVTSTIKDIRESKEKKVEKITTILNEVRLLSLQDLVKGKTKEPDKKEEKK